LSHDIQAFREETMFKVIGKYALAIAASSVVGAVSFGPAAQSAEQSAVVPSVTVRYADLNLNTAEGVEALYARLRAAARKACGPQPSRALVERIDWRTCYTEALEIAVRNVQSEQLSVLHRESARDTLS
jgi:UrcA family protein